MKFKYLSLWFIVGVLMAAEPPRSVKKDKFIRSGSVYLIKTLRGDVVSIPKNLVNSCPYISLKKFKTFSFADYSEPAVHIFFECLKLMQESEKPLNTTNAAGFLKFYILTTLPDCNLGVRKSVCKEVVKLLDAFDLRRAASATPLYECLGYIQTGTSFL